MGNEDLGSLLIYFFNLMVDRNRGGPDETKNEEYNLVLKLRNPRKLSHNSKEESEEIDR